MKRVFSTEYTRVFIGLALLFTFALAPSFIGVMQGKWPFFDDAVGLFAPERQWARDILAQGILPLWNPHLFLGMPFISNGQTAVLYPPNIVYWFLPMYSALLCDAFFHGVLLGGGGYFLARTLERSRSASWLCALCLMLGNSVAAHLYAGHMTWHAARAYLPLQIAVLICFQRDKRLRDAVVLAGLFALQLYSGYPPYVIWSAAWCGVFLVAWRAVKSHAKTNAEEKADATIAGQSPRLWLGHVALAGVILPLLCAAVALPFLETSRLAAHGVGLKFSEAVIPSSTLAGWARLALPTFFGGNHHAQWSVSTFPHEEAAYIGFIPLLLALGAPIWLMQRDRQTATQFNLTRLTVVLWVLLPVSMLIALGNHTPIYRFLFDYFPPLRTFRAPARWMEIWYFAACVLAAISFDALRDSAKNYKLLLSLLWLSTAVFVLLTLFVQLSSPAGFWLGLAQWNTTHLTYSPGERLEYASYLQIVALKSCMKAIGITLLSIFLIERWRKSSNFSAGTSSTSLRWQIGVLALIALDMILPFWSSAHIVAPEASQVQWPPAVLASYSPNTRWAFVYEGNDVNFGLNQSLPLDISSVGGYDTLAPILFFDFASSVEGRQMWNSQYQPMRFDPLLRVAGLTHVYLPRAHPLIAELSANGAKLAIDFGTKQNPRQLWKLENSPSMPVWPRYYLANNVVRAPFENQLSILKKVAKESSTVVLAPHIFRNVMDSPSIDGRVIQTQGKANVVHLLAETTVPQILVQNEAIFPGWRVWVNGRESKIERANYLFRGTTVPAGKSRVAIVYDNQTFRFATFLTLCGLALLAGIFSAARRSPPKPRPSVATTN